MTSDAELLRQYAEHTSQAAFTEFLQRHLGFVYSTALRITSGNAQVAADVAQNVFIRVGRDALRLAAHPTPIAWLHVTTRNVARTLMRSENTRRHYEHSASVVNDTTAATEWEKVRPLLDDALAQLGGLDREAVLLRFFAGQPFAEIGRRLSLTENAARMRVERALDKLHGILAARGVGSTGAVLGAVLTAHASSSVPMGLSVSIAASVFTAPIISGFSLFTFMSTTKSLVGLTSVLALAGLAVGIYEWRDGRNARLSAASATEELAVAREQLSTTTAKLRDTEQRLATLVAGAPAKRDQPPDADPAKPSAVPPVSASSRSNPSPFVSPEYVEAIQKKFIATLPLKFGPLYRKLGLSAEQVVAFEQAIEERNQTTLDIWAEAARQGIGQNDPSILKMTSEPILASEAKLRRVLGEGFGDYVEYDKTYAARAIVGSLAGSVYYTDTPLTAAQGETIAQAVATHTEQKLRPLVASRDGAMIYSNYTETNWAKVQEIGRQILAPAQLKALQNLIEQSQQDSRMGEVTAAKATSPVRKP